MTEPDRQLRGSQPSGPPGRRHDDAAGRAPLPRRAAARVIDFALGVALLVGAVLVVEHVAEPSPDGTGVMIISALSAYLAYQVYEVVCIGAWGGTFGKLLLGLRVVRADDGGRAGLLRASVRNFVPAMVCIGFFPAYPLVYLVAIAMKDQSGLIDQMAGTRVVSRHPDVDRRPLLGQ